MGFVFDYERCVQSPFIDWQLANDQSQPVTGIRQLPDTDILAKGLSPFKTEGLTFWLKVVLLERDFIWLIG